MDPSIGEVFEIADSIVGISNIILAGGAVRDHLNNKPIADYDLFIHQPLFDKHTGGFGESKSRTLLKALSKTPILGGATKMVNSYQLPHLNSIHKFRFSSNSVVSESDMLLNVMFTDLDPRDYVQRYFDIGLCECWMEVDNTGNPSFHTTENYDLDLKNKRLTCRIKEGMGIAAIGQSISYRLPKIYKKYPSFIPFIISEEVTKAFKEYKTHER